MPWHVCNTWGFLCSPGKSHLTLQMCICQPRQWPGSSSSFSFSSPFPPQTSSTVFSLLADGSSVLQVAKAKDLWSHPWFLSLMFHINPSRSPIGSTFKICLSLTTSTANTKVLSSHGDCWNALIHGLPLPRFLSVVHSLLQAKWSYQKVSQIMSLLCSEHFSGSFLAQIQS